MKYLLLIVLSLLLTSCGGPTLSRHPRVILDSAFLPHELRGVLAGLASWHRAAPEFSFFLKALPHPEIIGAALSEDFHNTIYIIRNEGTHDRACPRDEREIGDGHVGVTSTLGLGQVSICLDATYVNENGGLWKQITLHEVGHALGLDHRPIPSVMAITYGDGQDEPTWADVAALRALWE